MVITSPGAVARLYIKEEGTPKIREWQKNWPWWSMHGKITTLYTGDETSVHVLHGSWHEVGGPVHPASTGMEE